MWMLLLKTVGQKVAKKAVKKTLFNKWFWILFVLLPIALFIVVQSYNYFIFTLIADDGVKIVSEAEKLKESLKKYNEQNGIASNGNRDTSIGGTEIGGGANGDDDYSDTKDSAERIEGKTLLNEVYNAIVDRVADNNVEGYTVEYVLGTNFTESGGMGGGSWVPYISVPVKASQEKEFSLRKYSYKEAVSWKNKTGFDLKAYRRYIGPFQNDYMDWNTGMSTPNRSWGESEWGQFVSKAKASLDGSGDEKSDPHNYYDSLKMNSVKYKEKYAISKDLKLKSEKGRDDMMSLLVSAHYVGILGGPGSRKVNGSSYNHDESSNPHLALFREAVNEAQTGGRHYKQFKEAAEKSPGGGSHSTASSRAIRDFYMDNGWKISGGMYKKSYPDGNGYILIGNRAQDIEYSLLVYWYGCVARENIERILKKGSTD